MTLIKYFEVSKVSLMQAMAYPMRFVSTLLSSSTMLVLVLFLWAALFQERDEIRGYTFSAMFTYYAVTLVIARFTTTRSYARIMSREVASGDLSKFLAKPLNYNLFNLFKETTKYTIPSALSAIGLIFLIIFFPNVVTAPVNFPLFLVSLFFGTILNFLMASCLGTLAFWVIKTLGIISITGRFVDLLSGRMFPIVFYPVWLLSVLRFLPFKSTHYVPVSIYLGTFDFERALIEIVIQIFWILIFLVLFKFLWKKGIKNYGAVGN